MQCESNGALRLTAAQLRERGVDLKAAGFSYVTLLAVSPSGAHSVGWQGPAFWKTLKEKPVAIGELCEMLDAPALAPYTSLWQG